MSIYQGDGYAIEHRWKEEVIYWEGEKGFLFDGGWGSHPPTLYVPDAETWSAVTPDWLRGRRDVVVARLAARGTDRLEETSAGYGVDTLRYRCVSRR